MQEPYEAIIKLLDQKGAEYRVLEHEPVYTSEEAARVRKEPMAQGAKSLVLKLEDGSFLLAILPGDKKLSSKKTRYLLPVKNFRFAKPDEVEKVMDCKIGACYPVGNIIPLRTIADESLAQNEKISFNPGRHDRTITMKWEDYKRIVNPEIVDIVEP